MAFLTRSLPRRAEIIHAAGNPGEFSKVRYPEKGQLQMLRNLAFSRTRSARAAPFALEDNFAPLRGGLFSVEKDEDPFSLGRRFKPSTC
jgi:hypothetical protein